MVHRGILSEPFEMDKTEKDIFPEAERVGTDIFPGTERLGPPPSIVAFQGDHQGLRCLTSLYQHYRYDGPTHRACHLHSPRIF